MSERGCGEEEDGGFLVSVEKKGVVVEMENTARTGKSLRKAQVLKLKQKNALETSRNPQQCVIQMKMD